MWAPFHTLSSSSSLTFGPFQRGFMGGASAVRSQSERFKTGRQRYKTNRGQGRSKLGQTCVCEKWITECVYVCVDAGVTCV